MPDRGSWRVTRTVVRGQGGEVASAAFRKDEVLGGWFTKGNIGWLGGTASRASMAAVLIAAWLAPNSTESAVANGDTRTVTFSNSHTNESGSFTYMVNGVYDQGMLDKLNWFL